MGGEYFVTGFFEGGIFSLFLSFSSGNSFTRWVAAPYTKSVLWGKKDAKIVSGSRAEHAIYLLNNLYLES